MEPITGLVAGGLAIIAMILFLKVMNLSGDLAKTREDAERTQRELRKVAGQLESNRSKYQEKAQEASKKGSKAKDQKQRIAQLSNELQGAKSEANKLQDKLKEYSGQLTKLRIEREELRSALSSSKAKAQASSLPSTPATQAQPSAVEEAPAPDTQERPKRTSLDQLERDLERSTARTERMQEALTTLKKKLVQTTSEMRTLKRKNEHNRRAYIITQLQLDRTIDENYLLKHGTPPPNPQAERTDRQAMSEAAQSQNVVVNRDADPIQLPSAEELEALEAAPHAAIIGHVSDESDEPAEDATSLEAADAPVDSVQEEVEQETQDTEGDSSAESSDEDEEVMEAAASSAAEPSVTLESRPQPSDSSVKRRRKPKTEDVDSQDAPTSPPRPSR